MPVYHFKPRDHDYFEGVVGGENAADAVLKLDELVNGEDEQNDGILDCDDSINAYCQQLLAEYEVTELARAQVIEFVEWRLDGNDKIIIRL